MKKELQKSNENVEYQELLNEADRLYDLGKYGDAVALLDKVPKGCSEYSTSLYMKSMIIGINGDKKESFEIFKQFWLEEFGPESVDMDEEYKEFDMNDYRDLFDYGIYNYIFEDYEEAIRYFDLSLKLNPDQSEAFYYKALSFAFLGKFKKAVKTIDNAIKLNPDNVRYWNDKGAFLSQLNFTVKAHNAFDRAISIESNNYSWSNKGILYCRYGKLDEALDCFEKAIDLDENDVTSLVVSAAIYSELKNCQKADEYFDRAERIDCDNVIYLAERGKHLFNQNEFQKSIEYFDRYLKIDNEAAFVWMYKSMALSELGRDEESEMCFKKAYKLDPNSIDVFDEVVVIEE